MELSVMTVSVPIGPVGAPPKRAAALQCKWVFNSKKKELSPLQRFVVTLTAEIRAR